MRDKKILIFEDETIITREIEDTLKADGYNTLSIVDTGKEAIEKIEMIKPDLVLMDIKLKGEQDGIEIAKQIHNRFNIPIIFLTAYKSDNILERAKIAEPYAYIVKPFESRDILINIKMSLYKHEIETKVQKIRNELQLIIDSVPAMICYKDRNDRIMRINKSFADKFNLNFKEIVGKKMEDIFPEYSQNFKKHDSKVIESGNPKMNIFEQYDTKEGIRWFQTNKVPFRDSNGKIIGIIHISHDITELKEMENKLRRKEKLESLGILAAGIAHEFNNLLTGILGNISFAKMNIESSDKELFELLSKSEMASLKAKNLTRRLLTFSEGGLPITTLTPIRKLIIDTAQIALKESNIDAYFELPHDLWKVEIDKAQIRQVIQNIVLNANEAMEYGGNIIIKSKNTTIGDNKIPTIGCGKYVKITISDTGVGIPKENKKNIFVPFFSTKAGHSGLGLSAAYSIIKYHQGYIDIESKKGKGTCVIIYIPKSKAKNKKGKTKEIRNTQNVKGKILFMDDDDIVRDVAGKMLKNLGYDLQFAKDGKETIKIYKKLYKTNDAFDFLILDLTVPGGMGGKECINELRKIDPNITAIVSSGYSNDAVMTNYDKYGFSGVVRKPYNLGELKEVIKSVLNRGVKKGKTNLD